MHLISSVVWDVIRKHFMVLGASFSSIFLFLLTTWLRGVLFFLSFQVEVVQGKSEGQVEQPCPV